MFGINSRPLKAAFFYVKNAVDDGHWYKTKKIRIKKMNNTMKTRIWEEITIKKMNNTMGRRIWDWHVINFVSSDGVMCKLFEVILAEGLDPNDYEEPLCEASRDGYVKTVRKLLKLGANVNKGCPLHIAAKNGQAEVTKILIQAGADINGKDSGMSPLYIAAKKGHVEVVRTLLESNADIEAKNRDGNFDHFDLYRTALHAAAEGCHGEIIEMLIKANANIETRDSNRNTPLILACGGNYMGKIIAIKKLIDAGADVEARNEMGKSPLHALAENFYFKYSTRSTQEGVEVIQWLVDAGAAVDAKSCGDGWQPLHMAAQQGNVAMVEKLIELGADPWAETYKHRLVPLSLVKASDKETRKILLNAMKEQVIERCGPIKPKRVAKKKVNVQNQSIKTI